MFLKNFRKNIDSTLNLIKRLNGRIRRIVISSVSFVLVFTVLISVMAILDLTYAVNVSVNGNNCGYVSSTEDVDEAVKNISKSLYTDNDYLKPSVGYSHTIVSSNSIISSDQLADNIIEQGDICERIMCVVINDEPIAYVDSVDYAYQMLSIVSGNNAFYNRVEIKECYLTDQGIDNLASFDTVLKMTMFTDVDYTVNENDTASSIAAMFNISENSIPELKMGESIKLRAKLPALAIKTVIESESKESISGYQTGYKTGYNVTAVREYYVDGIKYSTEVQELGFVLKYPNKPTATKIVDAEKQGFCWPVDTGYKQYISSYWGDERDHKGYDIAAKKGTPILSAKKGRVVAINSYGSAYGEHFVVDHGNGIKTLYAHCSKLYVSVGDVVERGEVVALIGDTGRVTGTHLHFEVFKNGVRVDPMKYIGKR